MKEEDHSMTKSEWQKKLPMIATYSRIAFAPVIFALFYVEAPWALPLAAFIFIIASITDYLDGYWARLYNAVSNEGRLMDPIADKILVLTALILLLSKGRVDPLMVTLFLSRDILIGGIRSVAAADNVIISAQQSGKIKTAVQMIAIPCLFIYDPVLGLPLREIGYYGLWISVGLSLYSGTNYIIAYKKGSFKS